MQAARYAVVRGAAHGRTAAHLVDYVIVEQMLVLAEGDGNEERSSSVMG